MITLFRHQEIALSYMRMNDYFALFMEQGTGKTIPSLMRILDLIKTEEVTTNKKALVIAPKSALGSWERDIELFDKSDQKRLIECVDLINYDKVWRGDKTSKYHKEYACIILDEAHSIKNRTSKRSAFILKIATMSKYRYILTGTPISNGQLENIWSLYCFLNPYMVRGRVYSKIFKNAMKGNGEKKGSYYEFQDRYCILNRYFQPTSYINVAELQDIINDHSYRVKKIDCLDLPEKLPDEILKIDLSPKTKGLYKSLHRASAILEYEVLAENPLARMIKLRQLASGHLKNGDEQLIFETEKLDALQDIIESFESDKKLVIFADFKQSITMIVDLLKKLKISHVVLDGEQKEKKIWRTFQSDPKIRIIVCQYQTASAGIDLFASDTMIFYEPTLRSQILEQARDRIHRTGQREKCSYIHLITKGTIEVDIYRALSNYSDFGEKLFTEYMKTYEKRQGRKNF